MLWCWRFRLSRRRSLSRDCRDRKQRMNLIAILSGFIHAPYTTVHLWFDRQITDLHHAALLDTKIQWIFHKSRIRSYPEEQGSYVELVIAASRAQLKMERSEILDSALAELASFFPEVKRAKVVKSGILKEARATFSVLPGLDKLRPVGEESMAEVSIWRGTGRRRDGPPRWRAPRGVVILPLRQWPPTTVPRPSFCSRMFRRAES